MSELVISTFTEDGPSTSRRSSITRKGSKKIIELDIVVKVAAMADVAIMQPKSMVRPKVTVEANKNFYFLHRVAAMADVAIMQPKSMVRPKVWDEEVEEAYRFQLAGYRDAVEYKHVQKTEHVDRWPHNGYVKKLVTRSGCFYYYNRTRECPDKEIHKTKMYSY